MWETGGTTMLVLDAPWWTGVLGGMAAVVMGLLLYGWGNVPGLSRVGRWALGALRTLAVTGIIMLLLGPLVKHLAQEIEAPQAVVLVDQSASVVLDQDSSATRALSAFIQNLADELRSAEFTTSVLPFSDELNSPIASGATLSFDGKKTNLGGALESVAYQYEGRNLGGVVLVTDGRSNRGVNPEFGAKLPGAPLHSIGLGDTTRRCDRSVDQLNWNRIAYLDNQFPVEAVVGLHREQGAGSARIRLVVDGQEAASELIQWDENGPRNPIQRIRFLASADRVGTLPCTVTVDPSDSETVLDNNRQSFSIEILEKRRQVLVLGGAPHPDIGAVVSSLSGSDRYQTQVRIAGISPVSGTSGNLGAAIESADVLILHDLLLAGVRGNEWLGLAQNANKPILYIQTPAGADLAQPEIAGIEFLANGLTHAVRPGVYAGFDLFEIPEGFQRPQEDMPPIHCAMGTLRLSPAWQAALHRSLGGLVTDDPLVAFRDATGDAPKMGYMAGTGWWRLRTTSEAQVHQDERSEVKVPLDQFLQSAVQFLTSEKDVRQFRVTGPQELDEDLAIRFRAEVYDAALNPKVGANIGLTLTSTDRPNEVYEFVFSESTRTSSQDSEYSLDCGRLPPGRYTWLAKTLLSGAWVESKGEIQVQAIQVELASEAADHRLLIRLGDRTGGNFFGAFSNENSPQIQENIVRWFQNNRPPDLMFEEITLDEMIEWEWIGVIIMALLTSEWIFRRRTVGY
ncbi:MAG: vWA domain-containing protein [Flavobacteriales bacterium]